MTRDYHEYSLWLDGVPGELAPRPALSGAAEVDVAVVGAGYTGLWTAYYLKKADPSLRIAIVEKEIAGFGASGRNGGWCSSYFAASPGTIAREFGRDAAIAMQRAMFATVDEVGRVVAAEGIDARYHKGGALTLATSAAQLLSLQAEIDHERATFLDEADPGYRTFARRGGAAPAGRRLPGRHLLAALRLGRPGAPGARSGRRGRGARRDHLRTQPGARPHAARGTHARRPAQGGHRGERPRGLRGHPARPRPRHGAALLGDDRHRTLARLVLGRGRLVGSRGLRDERHLLIYAMRTTDDRIAIGGRGAPYHFGSRIKDDYDLAPKVFGQLHNVLKTLFPALGAARVTHTWGGCLGGAGDWFTSVGYDEQSGMAWAGGYVGDGVSTTNLAGRTLAELIAGADHGLAGLPWVGHISKRRETVPLRYLGVNLSLAIMGSADRVEARTGKPSRRAGLTAKLIGR